MRNIYHNLVFCRNAKSNLLCFNRLQYVNATRSHGNTLTEESMEVHEKNGGYNNIIMIILYTANHK